MYEFLTVIFAKLQSVFVLFLNAIFVGFDLMTFGFQRPASHGMEGIIRFHDDLMVILFFILGMVLYMLYITIYIFKQKTIASNESVARLTHATALELIWTVVPALILIIIAIPSFSLLYSLDENVDAFLTIKVIGHQWYWSYEIFNLNPLTWLDNVPLELKSINFDSYMINTETEDFVTNSVGKLRQGASLVELEENYTAFFKNYYAKRLLTVDNILTLPIKTNIAALITSTDVLHSWAIPSLGIKLDACPGRINETNVHILYPGMYSGQCSEICGLNHGFMPIGIGAIDVLTNTQTNIDLQLCLLCLTSSFNN